MTRDSWTLNEWDEAISQAALRIRNYVTRTPLIQSETLTKRMGTAVWLKCEQFQPMGAFKIRGAANALLEVSESTRREGAVTYSTGNHGLAVAYVCRALGVPAVVCISERVPEAKVAALRAMGAHLEIHGDSQDNAYEVAKQIARDEGRLLIEPFDDPAVIAGQGTIGLEIFQDIAEVDTLLIPVSGGGLASGIAAILRHRRPKCRLIGVSMQEGAAMYESVRQGQPVMVPEVPTLADSLQGGIGLGNRFTFPLIRKLLDDIVLVSEPEIQEAMGYLAMKEGMVVEGAAAVPVAYLLRKTLPPLGRVAAVLTGRNVPAEQSAEAITLYHQRQSLE